MRHKSWKPHLVDGFYKFSQSSHVMFKQNFLHLRCTRGAIMVHSCVNARIDILVLHTFGRRESSAPIIPFKYTPVPCCPRETFSWVYIFLLIFGRRWSTATTTLVESTRVPCYSVWTFLWGTFIFVSTRNMIMESVHQDGNMIAQRCHNECTESAPQDPLNLEEFLPWPDYF